MRASSAGPESRPRADLGLGPVGLEQLGLEPFELGRDDGAGDRVEGHGPEPGTGEAVDQVDVPAGPATLGLLVGGLGVGQLLPVGGGPTEPVEGQAPGLVDEEGLVPGQRRLGLGAAEGGHHVEVGAGEVAVGPGPLDFGQSTERPAPAHLAPGLALRDPAPDSQPGRGRAGPVGGPVAGRVEGPGGPGGEGLQAGQLTLEGDDRLRVGEGRGVGPDQSIEGLGEVVQSARCTRFHGDESITGV